MFVSIAESLGSLLVFGRLSTVRTVVIHYPCIYYLGSHFVLSVLFIGLGTESLLIHPLLLNVIEIGLILNCI